MSDTPTPLDLEGIRSELLSAHPEQWRYGATDQQPGGTLISVPGKLGPDVRLILHAPQHIAALLAEVDRLTPDAQRWANIRDTVIRLDAQTRPGLPMGDDDIEGLVLQILEHAARKSGRTHNTSALPGAINAS